MEARCALIRRRPTLCSLKSVRAHVPHKLCQSAPLQAAVTGEGPYANWSKHVADPFGYNLVRRPWQGVLVVAVICVWRRPLMCTPFWQQRTQLYLWCAPFCVAKYAQGVRASLCPLACS